MTPLGRLDELPQDYRDDMTRHNLVPLWPSLRALLPPTVPARQTRPMCWAYADIRPLLMRAGELTPIDKAERRVLVLANPGHGLDAMKASPAIYLGMQLLLPGEWAPAHRHTPNAVRMIVEGEGAYTTVDGQKCVMARGDLILTPTGLWHEHGHDGDQPVVWLDVLDLPLVHYLEASYHVNGPRQALRGGSGEALYGTGGLLPTPLFERADPPYPLLRYPWTQTRAALERLARELPAGRALQLGYVNPATGADAQNILGYHALMLRPGESLQLPARSPASVYHLIEGAVDVHVQDQHLRLANADTCCIPGYTGARLVNRSDGAAAFLFIADESPLHRKLGIYEDRGIAPAGG